MSKTDPTLPPLPPATFGWPLQDVTGWNEFEMRAYARAAAEASRAHAIDLERRVSEFVRTALVGTPSEATLHQLDRLIEVVADPTVKGHLKSMARQVHNQAATLTRLARRRAPGGVA